MENNGDSTQEEMFVLNLGQQYFIQGQEYEKKGKIEHAFKMYSEAANKYFYLCNLQTVQKKLQKKKEYEDLTRSAINQATWVKTQIDDEKKKLRGTSKKSENNRVVGVRLLGASYMEAFNFYQQLGDHYFQMATKAKGILPAVKMCSIFQAENLKQVNEIITVEDAKKANVKKINEIISLQNSIHKGVVR